MHMNLAEGQLLHQAGPAGDGVVYSPAVANPLADEHGRVAAVDDAVLLHRGGQMWREWAGMLRDEMR